MSLGKSLLCTYLTSSLRSARIDVTPANTLSPWMGEAEANLRNVFQRASQSIPCMIVIDEIELFGSRSTSGVGSRLLSTLLNEMDGIEGRDGILIVGCARSLYALDAALIRPGRFDDVLHVDYPNYQDRIAIIQCYTKSMLCGDIQYGELATFTEGYSGADIKLLCSRAGIRAMEEN